ncbi:MAG: hypothetical protein ACKVJN_03220 [Woeseiales bacterium]
MNLVRAVRETRITIPVETSIEIPEKTFEAVDIPLQIQNITNETPDVNVEEEVVIQPMTDWQARSLGAVKDVLDEKAKTYSINPNLDERRR